MSAGFARTSNPHARLHIGKALMLWAVLSIAGWLLVAALLNILGVI